LFTCLLKRPLKFWQFKQEKNNCMRNSFVESHKNLLEQVSDETMLYKIVSFENFCKMLEGNYLHFNRVDNYIDDKNDSNQPEQERLMNEKFFFEKDPNFTLRNYYEGCRKRSYACCFSLDIPKADHWKEYGGKEPEKAVCLVMNFGKLKSLLNIFHLNYGVVKYGSFVNDIISHTIRPNPIEYVYFKDSKYKKERELRISLSALGIGRIQISDGQLFDFPDSIAFGFNLNQALNFGAISHIEIADKDFLPELSKAMEDKRVVLKNSS